MAKIQKLTTYVAVVVDPSRMHGFTESGDILLVKRTHAALNYIGWNGTTVFSVDPEDVQVIETFNEPI